MHPSQWYSVTEGGTNTGGRHFVAYDLTRLLKYFAERKQQNEYMRLLNLSIGSSWAKESVDITYDAIRHADDIKLGANNPNGIAYGKGNINCEKQRIRVWSMGME
jgi:hypothetical protein